MPVAAARTAAPTALVAETKRCMVPGGNTGVGVAAAIAERHAPPTQGPRA